MTNIDSWGVLTDYAHSTCKGPEAGMCLGEEVREVNMGSGKPRH